MSQDDLTYDDETQARVERLYIQQVKPAKIAKATGITLAEVNARIKKVEDDLIEATKMVGPNRMYVLFGKMMARSQDRYNKLMVLHDMGGEELGALKAMKEEDKYLADLMAKPLEAVRQMDQEDEPAYPAVPRVASLWDDSDEIVIPVEDQVMDYNVLEKATVIGRRAEVQA